MGFIKRHIKAIFLILVAVAAIGAGGYFLFGDHGGEEETVYVETVASLTGQSSSAGLGAVNRLPGVVETQETWSVSRNMDVDIEEIHVTVGQEVNEGDPLFTYNIEKYEEDLQQAQIDLERMRNEYESTQEILDQLNKDKKNASSSEQASYTIQIKDQELTLKEKEIDIQLKEADIEKLEESIANATVTSGISGVVKSINNGTGADMGGSDNSFITVMKVGDFRIKGTVSEQNIGQLTVGEPVVILSRVDDRTWRGMISEIRTENPESAGNGNYYDGDSSNRSSKYPFYVDLESSEGLMMGQHVYVEPDYGQYGEAGGGSPGAEGGPEGAGGGSSDAGIWIDEYMIDMTDPNNPAVWKDVNGKIKKTPVEIGERNEDLGQVQILSGLELTDSIAFPDETLHDGMKTVKMSDMGEMSDMGDIGEMGEMGPMQEQP